MIEMQARASHRSLPPKAELFAVSTGLAGCLMMVLAFLYIVLYGQITFIEPNSLISHLELAVFAVGVAANGFVGFRIIRR
jgi:hypothetical protein